eukprot:2705895-Rhodomonas_salina.1
MVAAVEGRASRNEQLHICDVPCLQLAMQRRVALFVGGSDPDEETRPRDAAKKDVCWICKAQRQEGVRKGGREAGRRKEGQRASERERGGCGRECGKLTEQPSLTPDISVESVGSSSSSVWAQGGQCTLLCWKRQPRRRDMREITRRREMREGCEAEERDMGLGELQSPPVASPSLARLCLPVFYACSTTL